MSYILDALKRADAERGQTAGEATAEAHPHAHGFRPPTPWWRSGTGVLALAAALLGLAGLATLWWPTAKAPAPLASAPVASDPAPAPALSAVPASASQTAPEPIPQSPPAAATKAHISPAPILVPERPMAAQPAGAAASTALGPDPVPTMPAAVTRQPEPTPTLPPPARAAAAPSPPSAPVAANAPASAPPVKVTGATYSDNPAHRMLIVNGKIVLEGQDIEPGLKLEVITPHSAVLNHQGSRFNINY